ncbi:hypothetical protein SDJN02_08795, partial [Cucurbita argyrosperma subsp. argyrosperma]
MVRISISSATIELTIYWPFLMWKSWHPDQEAHSFGENGAFEKDMKTRESLILEGEDAARLQNRRVNPFS